MNSPPIASAGKVWLFVVAFVLAATSSLLMWSAFLSSDGPLQAKALKQISVLAGGLCLCWLVYRPLFLLRRTYARILFGLSNVIAGGIVWLNIDMASREGTLALAAFAGPAGAMPFWFFGWAFLFYGPAIDYFAEPSVFPGVVWRQCRIVFEPLVSAADFTNDTTEPGRRRIIAKFGLYLGLPWAALGLAWLISASSKGPIEGRSLSDPVGILAVFTALVLLGSLRRDAVTRNIFLLSGRFTIVSRGGFLLFSTFLAALIICIATVVRQVSEAAGIFVAYCAAAVLLPAYLYVSWNIILSRTWYSCGRCRYQFRWFEHVHQGKCPRCGVRLVSST